MTEYDDKFDDHPEVSDSLTEKRTYVPEKGPRNPELKVGESKVLSGENLKNEKDIHHASVVETPIGTVMLGMSMERSKHPPQDACAVHVLSEKVVLIVVSDGVSKKQINNGPKVIAEGSGKMAEGVVNVFSKLRPEDNLFETANNPESEIQNGLKELLDNHGPTKPDGGNATAQVMRIERLNDGNYKVNSIFAGSSKDLGPMSVKTEGQAVLNATAPFIQEGGSFVSGRRFGGQDFGTVKSGQLLLGTDGLHADGRIRPINDVGKIFDAMEDVNSDSQMKSAIKELRGNGVDDATVVCVNLK